MLRIAKQVVIEKCMYESDWHRLCGNKSLAMLLDESRPAEQGAANCLQARNPATGDAADEQAPRSDDVVACALAMTALGADLVPPGATWNSTAPFYRMPQVESPPRPGLMPDAHAMAPGMGCNTSTSSW